MSLSVLVYMKSVVSKVIESRIIQEPLSFLGEVDFDNYADFRSQLINGAFFILKVGHSEGAMTLNVKCSEVTHFLELEGSDLKSAIAPSSGATHVGGCTGRGNPLSAPYTAQSGKQYDHYAAFAKWFGDKYSKSGNFKQVSWPDTEGRDRVEFDRSGPGWRVVSRSNDA